MLSFDLTTFASHTTALFYYQHVYRIPKVCLRREGRILVYGSNPFLLLFYFGGYPILLLERTARARRGTEKIGKGREKSIERSRSCPLVSHFALMGLNLCHGQ